MEAYEEIGCIGRGAQGGVYTVRRRVDGRLFVLKRMTIFEPEARRMALQEAETLQRLQHPAVVGYHESFVHQECLCIVMEYCCCDLASRIASRRNSPFEEAQILQWFVQLVLALEHVHGCGILHRDLKTKNIFITADDQLKLGDFGIAKVLTAGDALGETCVGTPYYMAPELFKGEAYGGSADVWSLGCILYELATRRRAFESPNLSSLSIKIVRGEYGPDAPHVSVGLLSLIRSMLSVSVTSRASMCDLLQHSLLRPHFLQYASTQLVGRVPFGTIACINWSVA